MRAAAATAALRDYSWERIARDTVAVYEQTTRGLKPRRKHAIGDRRIW
jgi:hypothetical protein